MCCYCNYSVLVPSLSLLWLIGIIVDCLLPWEAWVVLEKILTNTAFKNKDHGFHFQKQNKTPAVFDSYLQACLINTLDYFPETLRSSKIYVINYSEPNCLAEAVPIYVTRQNMALGI